MTVRRTIDPDTLPLSAELRVDQACLRFEAAWKVGRRPRVEDFISHSEGEERLVLLRELIRLDVYYRRGASETPCPEDYRERFREVDPTWTDDLLSADNPDQQATLAPRAGPRHGAVLPLAEIPFERPFGDFDQLERIGQGGMGVVFRARQKSVNRVVALKMIRSGQLASEIELQRFRAEAEATAQLDHPNIVPIYVVGEHAGQPYFSMKYVEGPSLAGVLASGQSSGSARDKHQWTARLVAIVARAVHHAHQRGILHRDLKPANVLLQEEEGGRRKEEQSRASSASSFILHPSSFSPMITDFGLAKRVSSDSDLTATGAVVGTPSYMAPEQGLAPKSVTTAVDVWSLGAILYETLTGRPPFRGETTLDTLRQAMEDEPESPRSIRAGIDRDLETICLRCLQKEPEKRYGSAAALADDLDRWLVGDPIAARPVGRFERGWRWCRRNPVVAGLLTAVAASLVLGITATGLFAVRAEKNAEQARNNEARAEEEKVAADTARETATQDLYFAQMGLAAEADESPVGARRLRNLLDAWRPLGDEPDRRGWEWYCLRGQIDQSDLTIFSTGGVVRAVCWGADGRRLASADQSSTVRVWDPDTGRQLSALATGIRDIRALTWSPDGRYLAVGGDAPPTIGLWDMQTGKKAASLTGHASGISSLTWSQDSRRLASGSKDGNVKVWDTSTFGELKNLEIGLPVRTVAWSPTGTRLAVSQGKDLRLFDTTTWEHRTTDIEYPHLVWSPNGQSMATAAFNVVHLWHAADLWSKTRSATRQAMLYAQGMFPNGVSWRSNNRLAVARYDSTIEVHYLPTKTSGSTRTVLRGHEEHVQCVSWSPDGRRLASGSSDRTIRIWDPSAGRRTRLPAGFGTHVVSWSPDSERLVTSGFDGATHLWQRSTGQLLATLAPSNGQKTNTHAAFRWSPDGRCLAGSTSADGVIQLCDPVTAKAKSRLGQHGSRVWALSWSPDGRRLASGGGDGWIKVWDVASRKNIASLRWSGKWPHDGIAWSPDGRWLAATLWSGPIQVWDAGSYQKQVTLTGHREAVYALAWSPDSQRLASGGEDHVIRLWDVEKGEQVLTLDGHMSTVADLSWRSDGRYLASASWDRSVKLWDMERGKEIASLYGHDERNADCVSWSPDGLCLASGGNNAFIRLWDAVPGYAAERSPALLPFLERKLQAQPNNFDDLRLRAEIHARRGAWEEAVADWTKAVNRGKNTDARCFEAGWWSRGPLASDDAPDEDCADIDPTSTPPAGVDRTLLWRPVTLSANGYVNLERLIPGQRAGRVQLLARVYSPRKQRLTARLGCGGSVHAFLNGRCVFSRDEARMAEMEDEKVTLELEAEWNTVLLRVEMGTANWIAFTTR
jgi:WD40 repeat protein/tRNA A-37 threonylcarbamoyl transferase component Bud32